MPSVSGLYALFALNACFAYFALAHHLHGAASYVVMKAVIQRVTSASVEVGGETIAAIDSGMLVLLGIAIGDTPADAARLAKRCWNMRIFRDDAGRMNESVEINGGRLLVVSQFTLLADTSRGRRPGYSAAAPPEIARPLYEAFCDELRGLGGDVSTGRFGAEMAVSSISDGPVTLIVETT